MKADSSIDPFGWPWGDPPKPTRPRARIAGREIDEVVLSTLPPGISRWLGRDIPSRLRGAVSVPVTVVNDGPAPPSG